LVGAALCVWIRLRSIDARRPEAGSPARSGGGRGRDEGAHRAALLSNRCWGHDGAAGREGQWRKRT